MTTSGPITGPPASRIRVPISGKASQMFERAFPRVPLQSDRYDGKFLVALGGVLCFTLVAYWSLTDYWDVQWYAGEDGVSEWWSVAAYVGAGAMAAATGWLLFGLGHRRIGVVHLVLALVFLVGALEEISWGQRLLGWSTPDSLSRINEQEETSFHNLYSFDGVFTVVFFWGSILAMAGAVARAVLHRRGKVTTADLVLPSLILSPALLMIIFWIAAGQPVTVNPPRVILAHFDLSPMGSEIPEVLMGLCISIYTYGNLRTAATLKRLGPMPWADHLGNSPSPARRRPGRPDGDDVVSE